MCVTMVTREVALSHGSQEEADGVVVSTWFSLPPPAAFAGLINCISAHNYPASASEHPKPVVPHVSTVPRVILVRTKSAV